MSRDVQSESGMTMVESLIAILILLAGLLTMAQVLAFSVLASKNFGRDSGKATILAHDRMERLTGLVYTDAQLNAGGSVYPVDPVTGYSDNLKADGSLATSGISYYTRQWQIIDRTTPQRKTIIVSVRSNKSFQYGTTPSTTLVTEITP